MFANLQSEHTAFILGGVKFAGNITKKDDQLNGPPFFSFAARIISGFIHDSTLI